MIKFLLVVESKNEEGIGDRVLHKQCEWHLLPRIGERLILEGNTHSVTEVDHDLSKGGIEVYVQVDDTDFDRLRGFPGYEVAFDVATN